MIMNIVAANPCRWQQLVPSAIKMAYKISMSNAVELLVGTHWLHVSVRQAGFATVASLFRSFKLLADLWMLSFSLVPRPHPLARKRAW